MKTTIELTEEKFKEIYTDEKLRNQVAFAHAYCDKLGHEQHKQTCSYPVTYIVTEDQIKEANVELERAKKETFDKYENSLLFVGMGMNYEPRYEDDICNHRIRTEFLNSKGKQFFVEFSTNGPDGIHCNFSIDRDKQKELKDNINKQFQFYNFGNLERSHSLGICTKQHILSIVNRVFDCKFTEIIIDNYNIHCNDQEIICKSPK